MVAANEKEEEPPTTTTSSSNNSRSNTESPVSSGDNSPSSEEVDIEVLSDVAPDLLSQSVDDIDAETAIHLSKLSIQDREKVYFDVHGVRDEIQETPELLEKSLTKLEKKLKKVKNKSAYDEAKQMDSEYVMDNDFRLKFLRADRFDSKQAALRLARHFQAKLELFGKEKLVSNITQDDLDTNSLCVLNYGYPQLLPLRDRAGRIVCVWFPGPKINVMSLEAKVRSLLIYCVFVFVRFAIVQSLTMCPCI